MPRRSLIYALAFIVMAIAIDLFMLWIARNSY